MEFKLTELDVQKLQRELQRARIAALVAIESGDCKAVARTLAKPRGRNAINFADAMLLEPA